MYVPMGSLANRHGRVIAENIAGFDAEFSGALGTFVVKVFDLNVGSVGLSAAAAAGAGIETASVWGSFPDKPDYYPDARMMTLKMVYEPGSGRILGLQAVGTGDICRRVDVMSALVQSGATVADALAFEHGYAPPYAEALDPIHHLAAMAQAQQRGNISLVAPDIDPSAYDDDTVWLDVREPAEIEAEPWPHDADGGYGRLVAIPLNELRERLDDLDKNCNIVVICKRGPRAYQALVILRQAGFANVAFVGGGFQASHGFV